MTKRAGLATLMLLSVVVTVAPACSESSGGSRSGDDDDFDPNRTLGDLCQSDSDCESGFCLTRATAGFTRKFCSKPCATDDDCPSTTFDMSCGIFPDMSRYCVAGCGYDRFACVDGVPVACEVAGETHCDVCPCPDLLRCEPGVGCLPLSDVGGPCTSNSDCNTNNCSAYAGVCRTPVGQACAGTQSCDLCYQTGAWSYCSRKCLSDAECNGGRCLGLNNVFTCFAPCESLGDPLCPGTCEYDADFVDLYCDCECVATEPPRGLGNACSTSIQCRSGLCLGTYGCASCPLDGWCSQACTSSTECGNDMTCVSDHCPPGVPCEPSCMPTCEEDADCGSSGGTLCRALQGIDGVPVRVCDTRNSDGLGCRGNADCISNRCIGTTCAPTAGFANGEGCTLPADCQSNSCVNAVCRGTALIGEACGGPYDCSTGQCCTAGQNAGLCAPTCPT